MTEQTNQPDRAKAEESAEGSAAGSDEIKVEESKSSAPPRGALASLADIEQEVERAFERFFKSEWLRPAQWDLPSLPSFKDSFEGRTPKVNVIDRDEEVVVEAELPGVEKADIQVSVDDSNLTIRASRREETEEEEGEYHRREISSGYYLRTLPLPGAVDGDKARAAFENGLLVVTIPKSETARKRNVAVD